MHCLRKEDDAQWNQDKRGHKEAKFSPTAVAKIVPSGQRDQANRRTNEHVERGQRSWCSGSHNISDQARNKYLMLRGRCQCVGRTPTVTVTRRTKW